jgi:hypothetical protein
MRRQLGYVASLIQLLAVTVLQPPLQCSDSECVAPCQGVLDPLTESGPVPRSHNHGKIMRLGPAVTTHTGSSIEVQWKLQIIVWVWLFPPWRAVLAISVRRSRLSTVYALSRCSAIPEAPGALQPGAAESLDYCAC